METGLRDLARLDAAPGDERRVIDLIADRVGGTQRRGSNGTLVAQFGQGRPRTLLVAGVDEPGYAVSAIQPDGYLRLQSLADGPFGSRLAGYFVGQHVHVSTAAGRVLPGVVAAPSVHFGARGRFQRTGTDDLFVDLGAASARQVRLAGVNILDRVTLDKHVAALGDDWLAAPWISSRSGAALLLALSTRLAAAELAGTVAVAFVTQQYPHNAGLVRLLESTDFERVVLLLPNGEPDSGIAAVRGYSEALAREIAALAHNAGVKLERRPAHGLAFGPFGGTGPWRADQDYALIWPAAQNGGTPAAAVSQAELSQVLRLLSLLVGTSPPAHRQHDALQSARTTHTAPRRESLAATIERLVVAHGVSGKERAVRELVQGLVPPYARQGMRTDAKGNLIVRLGSGRQPDVTFIAHMDEIGFSVSGVAGNGRVALLPTGGGDPRLFRWQSSRVHGKAGSVDAVMTGERSLEIGQTIRESGAEHAVFVGDTVTVLKRFRRLLGYRVSARSLDDRLGCATLIEALRRLAVPTGRARGTVDFVFSVGEEVGCLGARHYARSAVPAQVFAIDTFVTSDSPLESQRIALARLGHGAVLRAVDESGMTPVAEIARISALARQHKIPLQLGITAGGNDGSAFRSLETVNVPIGFPLRYAHSAVETADLRDAEAVVDLVEVLAREVLRGR